jgi:hypothetical protein
MGMTATVRSPSSGHGLALLLAGAVLAAWVGVMALSLKQASLPPETDGLVVVSKEVALGEPIERRTSAKG